MSKQLTPMGRLLNDLNAELAEIRPNAESVYRGALKSLIIQIATLLPEEKQFANEAFGAGVELGILTEKFRDREKWVKFPDYYKKYEDDN